MSNARPFRAVAKTCFALTGRGTILSVEIVEGTVAAGDRLVVPLSDRSTRVVRVHAVDFVDRDIGRPTYRAEVALMIGELAPEDFATGQEVRAATLPEAEP